MNDIKENKEPESRTKRQGAMVRFIVKKKKLLKYAALTLLGGTAALAGTLYWYVDSLDIAKLDQPLPAPTILLDRYGKPASQLSASSLDPVPLAEMPKQLIDAVIAVEDRRFYEHAGIDVRSIGRALVRDVFAGGYAQGASTITQQLAKNMFLTTDKSLARKLKEATYALKIDMVYDKNDILDMYLNSIYFGEGSWGVQSAAKTYFGKQVRDLTLPEAALIAALPKAPSRYSPVKNADQALERRNEVLGLMRDQGKISEAAYAEAVAAPIGTTQGKDGGDGLKGSYPAYVDAVIQEAVDDYGFTEEQLLTGGLRITTELDPVVQRAVSEVYANDALFPAGKPDQPIQSGAVVLDHASGGIRALAGGRGAGVFRGFSHATQLRRQPGSTFKPIVVYGPALERGYNPYSVLYDGPLNIAGYTPQDWDHQSRGQVTMLDAIVHSWNVPAVWLLNELGIDSGLQFAGKLGIELPKADRQLGIALGGLNEGISPKQLAQAYGAFAADGQLYPSHTIVKIETGDGHVLVEAKAKPKAVMQPSSARTMTAMLLHAVSEGTGKNAAMSRPVAGKSGTTQLPAAKEFAGLDANAAKDAWFVGYTPELTAAVWVGYDQTDRNHYLTTSGGAVPAVVFKEIMTRALAGKPVAMFPNAVTDQLFAGNAASGSVGNEQDPVPKREDKQESKGNGHGGKKR